MTNSKTNILLLEDNTRESKRIQKNLKSYGWKVKSVSNSKEFKKALFEKNFDIFVIDYDIPDDRGNKTIGGGEKSLEILKKMMGVVPVIIYSGNLKSEIESSIIEKGFSFLLTKGGKGSNLSSLIKNITSENDEKIGLKIKSYLSNRLSEKTFFMKLISEKRSKKNNKTEIKVLVEVQRLYDDDLLRYEITIDEKGRIVNAVLKRNK